MSLTMSLLLSYQAIIELGLALVVLLALSSSLRTRHGFPFPPGPPAEFLFGHTRIMPRENVAETYAKWGREYGTSNVVEGNLPSTG